MIFEIKIPEVGESVREAVLAQWYKRDGDSVKKGELLFLIETDKVTLEIAAESDGILKINVSGGETVPVGTVVGTLDTEAKPEAAKPTEGAAEKVGGEKESQEVTQETPPTGGPAEGVVSETVAEEKTSAAELLSPSVRRLVAQEGIEISKVRGTGAGGRITKADVLEYLEKQRTPEEPVEQQKPSHEAAEAAPMPRVAEEQAKSETAVTPEVSERQTTGEGEILPDYGETTRKPMSRIRLRIAERLLEARRNTAMLTTFNEIDMGRVQDMRAQFKEAFRDKHGVSLGIMSFFIKASIVALKEFPEVNAFIEGKDIVYHHNYHIGVAIGGERGLVVPVIRFAERYSFAQLEAIIRDYVKKVEQNKLELKDLEGGTFTISNGGVYGSLLSTPILNTPQSGILGMHKIEDRPVAGGGQIAIRPMMYVALSYDHRIIDGRQAVSFLKRIKECIENPERIMVEI